MQLIKERTEIVFLPEKSSRPLWEESPELLRVIGINMRKAKNNLIIEAALPEFEVDEVIVSPLNHDLEISARRKKSRESLAGRQSFWRRLSLPPNAHPEQLKYKLSGGTLKINMPLGKEKGV